MGYGKQLGLERPWGMRSSWGWRSHGVWEAAGAGAAMGYEKQLGLEKPWGMGSSWGWSGHGLNKRATQKRLAALSSLKCRPDPGTMSLSSLAKCPHLSASGSGTLKACEISACGGDVCNPTVRRNQTQRVASC
ncbi:UNVERIFIED_CONTAM: hypothetical protein FKN15_000965 [Acipenser sinensis]